MNDTIYVLAGSNTPNLYPGLIHKIAVGFILIQVFTVGSNLSCISLEEKSERTSQRDD